MACDGRVASSTPCGFALVVAWFVFMVLCPSLSDTLQECLGAISARVEVGWN